MHITQHTTKYKISTSIYISDSPCPHQTLPFSIFFFFDQALNQSMVACAAAHLHAAMALQKVSNSNLQVRFCNGEFMGKRLTLQHRKQDVKYIPNLKWKVCVSSLIANTAAESKVFCSMYFGETNVSI